MSAAAVPLVLPSNCVYDAARGTVTRDPGRPADGLCIVNEGLAVLADLQGPLAVLCIAGPARTGKSYILSRLLGGGAAFAVGHTVAPKTMGIWIARRTLPCEGFQTVLLDCEGSDAVQGSGARDSALYSMAVLISSMLVYNSTQAPRATDLDRLSFVANLAKRVCTREGVRARYADLQAAFPDLVWLLRDVGLAPVAEEEEGEGEGEAKGNAPPFTWSDYLAQILTEVDAMDEESVRRNAIRLSIRKAFRSFQCLALPVPTTELPRFSDAQLTPAFNSAFADLRAKLLASLRPKHAPAALTGGTAATHFTGPMLADFVRALVPVLSDPNALPALEPLYVQVLRNVVERAADAAVREYETALRTHLRPPVGWPELMGAHRTSLSAAWRTFDAGASGLDEALKSAGRERLVARIVTFAQAAPAEAAWVKCAGACGWERTRGPVCVACLQPTVPGAADARPAAQAREVVAALLRSGVEAELAAATVRARNALITEPRDGAMRMLLAEALLRQGRAEEAGEAAAAAAEEEGAERRVAGGALHSAIAENERAAERACLALIEAKYAPLAERVRGGALASVAQFDAELRAAVHAYMAEARGPRVVAYAARFLRERAPADRRSVETRAREERLRAEAEAAARRAAQAEAALQKERKDAAARLAEAQRALAQQAEGHKKMLAEMAAAEERRRQELLATHKQAQAEADAAHARRMQALATVAALRAAPPSSARPRLCILFSGPPPAGQHSVITLDATARTAPWCSYAVPTASTPGALPFTIVNAQMGNVVREGAGPVDRTFYAFKAPPPNVAVVRLIQHTPTHATQSYTRYWLGETPSCGGWSTVLSFYVLKA